MYEVRNTEAEVGVCVQAIEMSEKLTSSYFLPLTSVFYPPLQLFLSICFKKSGG